MTPNEKDYMERYIYQVTRRLRGKQREEARMELEELISDMWSDCGSMEEALTRLGDPADFAKQYQNGPRYLIGPEYMENYLWFVKIVLLCSSIPILIVSVIDTVAAIPGPLSADMASSVIRAIARGTRTGLIDVFASGLASFGAVTLIFAFMEWRKIKIDIKEAEKWSVDKLADRKKAAYLRWSPGFLEPVPDKRAIISRGDSAVGVVFIVIFTVMLVAAPHFFSVVFPKSGSVTMVPIFNLDQWDVILPVFVFSMCVGLVDEVFRLVTGCYCRPVMICNILCGTLQIVLSAVILKALPFWNPDFASQLQEMSKEGSDLAGKVAERWNGDWASNILLAVIVIATLAEMGVTLYKTLRYGTRVRS